MLIWEGPTTPANRLRNWHRRQMSIRKLMLKWGGIVQRAKPKMPVLILETRPDGTGVLCFQYQGTELQALNALMENARQAYIAEHSEEAA